MEKKRKYFNLRLFFIGFLGMIVGILNFYNIFNLIWLSKITPWLIIFGLVFLIVLMLIIVCIVIERYRKFLKYLIVFCLLFLVAGCCFSIKLNSISSYKDFGDDCNIMGEVKSHYYKNSYYYISLENVEINGEEINSDLGLYVVMDESINEDLSLGDKIFTKGDISFTPLVTDKINIQKYVSNNVYTTNVVASSIEVVNEKPNFLQFLQIRLKSILNRGMTQENADIAYGVLVGEKEELNNDIIKTFSYAGISHILAVSGLHVGFLVGLITFILNLCKVGRRKRFLITSVILILYTIFCNFTPSILRASFMSIVLLLAGVLGEEYDGLNSLGVAGIIIMLLFPEQLFSLGFQLSFMCVFMIITLADKLSRLLAGWKVPQVISSSISVSLCVTLGSSLILANALSEVSIISIVANLIVIPLFSIIFPLLFVVSLIGMIVPVFGELLFIPQILLHLVKLIANFFAGINFAHFRVFRLGYLLLLVFVIMSIIIKYFMANRLLKTSICSILAISCIGLLIGGVQEKVYETSALYTNYQFETSSTLLTTETNGKYLIGIDNYSTLSFLTDMKIRNIDAVIVQDFEISRKEEYIEFFKNINVDKLIIPQDDRYYYEMFGELNKYVTVVSVDEWSEGVRIEFLNNEKNIAGVLVDTGNKTLLFPSSVSKEKLNIIAKEVTYVDYVVVNTSKYDFRDFGINYSKIIHSKDLKFNTNSSISLKNKSHYVLQL